MPMMAIWWWLILCRYPPIIFRMAEGKSSKLNVEIVPATFDYWSAWLLRGCVFESSDSREASGFYAASLAHHQDLTSCPLSLWRGRGVSPCLEAEFHSLDLHMIHWSFSLVIMIFTIRWWKMMEAGHLWFIHQPKLPERIWSGVSSTSVPFATLLWWWRKGWTVWFRFCASRWTNSKNHFPLPQRIKDIIWLLNIAMENPP